MHQMVLHCYVLFLNFPFLMFTFGTTREYYADQSSVAYLVQHDCVKDMF